MKKEKSFRVFVIYALLLQFAILASQNKMIQSSLPATVKNYNARDATVQVIISFADISPRIFEHITKKSFKIFSK